MFKTKISSENRYTFGEEWLNAYKKLIYSNKIINFKGEFIQFKNGQCFPPPPPPPPKINFISAAFSEDGRKFAIKNCDILFTMFSSLDTLKKNNNHLRMLAKQHKRNILIFSPIHVVCKKSRSEAHEFTTKNILKQMQTWLQ